MSSSSQRRPCAIDAIRSERRGLFDAVAPHHRSFVSAKSLRGGFLSAHCAILTPEQVES
jgi:hypothetical protein